MMNMNTRNTKVSVTVSLEEPLVDRIQAMKAKCNQLGDDFSLTRILINAVEIELKLKEKLCGVGADERILCMSPFHEIDKQQRSR